MTLQNLLATGQLIEHPVDRDEIRRLLDAARRNLQDSRIQQVSLETRYDASYKAIMQSSLAAMMANGYRPNMSSPGHHMTLIQALVHTIGLPAARIRVLDTLRRKRNLSDYTGEDIDDGSVHACVAEAERLLVDVTTWLETNRPHL